jgi:hypothetical protein
LAEQAISLCDLSVAVLTFGARAQMRPMAEKNKIRFFVDPNKLLDGRAIFLN